MKKQQPVITHDEWIKEFVPPLKIEIPPNSVTIEDVMRITNRKRSTTVRMLNDKVEAGELEKEMVCVNGRNCWFYYPPQKKSNGSKEKSFQK